ncbi:MAG: FHA domain-containing protein [Candidatus Aureabacteria bacterium]|nr:FHA domain-containing protein [Candidatus Auribacterota bacterium]
MIGKITFLSGMYQGKAVYFRNVLNIGRNPSNDLQLPFPSVSRDHSRISISGGESTIKDLKSNNGTFLNGKIVQEKTAIKSGDVIRISSFEMKFELLDEKDVDPKLIKGKTTDFISAPKSTVTGFTDIKNINLNDIEKDIRE